MKDVVIVGGGLAGLAAGWRLRHWDTVLLESGSRVGGRIRSERRGRYWLNWGGHVFAGPGSSTAALLSEAGIAAAQVPGSLAGVAMNGKLLLTGPIQLFPFRIPMPLPSRIALVKAGIKVSRQVLRYASIVRRRPGEDPALRQQRIYDFENGRSFSDFVGELPEDAAALFYPTVTRSAADPHEISAGAGIGYFSLVWNIGQGLNRNIVGGPSTLTQGIASALGDRVQLDTEVVEIVHGKRSVVVRYRQDGVDREVEGRCVVLATPATVSHRVAVDLPRDVRDALGQVKIRAVRERGVPHRRVHPAAVGRRVRHRRAEAVVQHRAEPVQPRSGRRDDAAAGQQHHGLLPGRPRAHAAGPQRRGDPSHLHR